MLVYTIKVSVITVGILHGHGTYWEGGGGAMSSCLSLCIERALTQCLTVVFR